MAANTPTMSPSMMRNEAKYCAGRFSITDQPAMITGTVMNVVKRISGSAMPSTPSA